MKTTAAFELPEFDAVGLKVTLGAICWIALTSLTPRATNASPVTAVTATGVVCRLSETRRAVTTMSPTGTCSSCAACSAGGRSEEHTSELQSLMRISYAVFCLKKKKKQTEK